MSKDSDGKHISSHFTTGYCPICKRRNVEILVNVFEHARYYVCQVCGAATVAKKR